MKKTSKAQYMKKLENLEWYTMVFNLNTRKLENFNIFDSFRFCEGVAMRLAARDEQLTYEEFEKAIKSECMYTFWSKCEYEMVVMPLINRGSYQAKITNNDIVIEKPYFLDDVKDLNYKLSNTKEEFEKSKVETGFYWIQNRKYDHSKKIDVWEQIAPNLKHLCNYILKETGYQLQNTN